MNVMNSDETFLVRYREMLLFVINSRACHLFLLASPEK
jgi:hypothetical protein